MEIAVITGAGGLIGSETVSFFSAKGFNIIGIDNDMRQYFFGPEASTAWNTQRLQKEKKGYTHHGIDIRDLTQLQEIFAKYNSDIKVVVHTAAQPSHDWAAKEPHTDFTINAHGTLNLLELTRTYCPSASFMFTSTNKVYGDTPNLLPLIEKETRWEIAPEHPYAQNGIDETMSIDQTKHSLFGASKASADLLVQEYGRYFGLKTACFRGGCLTGPNHGGAQLHGFLSYLMKCTLSGQPYVVLGYKGKQVRDNIHSYDFVNMLWHYHLNPRPGEVYNAGGGRHSNCSVLEAIALCEQITGKRLNWTYDETHRIGDHIWWISDVSKFRRHYPDWSYAYSLEETLTEIYHEMQNRFFKSNPLLNKDSGGSGDEN